MTISSSLNAGVTGLNVNASKLATISDNIANSATFGYKRADTEFSSLVISEGHGAYTAGGVSVTSTRAVASKGSLASTTNPLDIAVGGRGMLPVTPVASLGGSDASTPLRLVSTGAFRTDEDGVVRTASGLALLGWSADENGEVPARPRDTVAGLEPITVNFSQVAASPTTLVAMGVNLPATATRAGASGDPLTVPIEYYDNVGSSQTLTSHFTPLVPATGSSNTWTLTFEDTATDAASNPVAEFTMVFDDSRGGGGRLDSITPVFGGSYSPAEGKLGISVAGGPIDIAIGPPGTTSRLTQLSSSFAPTGITKNGSPAGILTGMEFDENGFLSAVYDSGLTRVIYQVPVVDVPNMDGLRAEDNQSFSVTDGSGDFYLWTAGDGPVGSVVGYALEESTTDIAGELTQLIATQRAYSSNAKVIQTVDEMLQETTNIKR